MLQMSFPFPINKGRVLPKQTPMHDSKSCKILFSFLLTRGESYPNKLQCMTPNIAKSFLFPINKWRVLPKQIPVHASKCCKRLLSFPLARGESYPTKLQCMTLQMLETSLLIPISKMDSNPTKLQCTSRMLLTSFLTFISKGVALPN